MAIAADIWVETVKGRVKAYEITPGTYVFGMDGMPTKVKSVQQYTPQQMYYVELSDGSNFECDQFLVFPTRTFAQRVNTAKAKKPGSSRRQKVYRYKSVTELNQEGLKHPRQPDRFQYTVDTVAPLQYGYEDHAVPPFVAGMWFGRFNQTGRYKIPDTWHRYAKEHIQRSKQFAVVEKKDHWEIRPSIEATFLKDYAIIPVKEFPYKYLYGTPEQRLEFLQGYFALRPTAYEQGKDRFRLRKQNDRYSLEMIQVMCESLGIKTTLTKQTSFWCLIFKTQLPLMPDLPPAKCKFGERHRRIVKIEPCEPRPCVHIETEKPIAVSDSFIPIWHSHTNNKKS